MLEQFELFELHRERETNEYMWYSHRLNSFKFKCDLNIKNMNTNLYLKA